MKKVLFLTLVLICLSGAAFADFKGPGSAAVRPGPFQTPADTGGVLTPGPSTDAAAAAGSVLQNRPTGSAVNNSAHGYVPAGIIPDGSFPRKVSSSFYNNIIQEKRYLLILHGLKTTVIITVLATLLGTVLGGIVCFMRMSSNKILQMPSRIYISLLRGVPVLVVLMIIYYVVFASVDISPVLIAVIAFGLNFAAYVSEMFRTGVESVDRGQTEAGIAMGFTRVAAFINIVLPQAVQKILPVYKGEMISLLKMTSVVGYIAVHDLTKASDIIRSRTFDAFFPLIMVAVLYFLIAWLLTSALGYMECGTNPKTRPDRIWRK